MRLTCFCSHFCRHFQNRNSQDKISFHKTQEQIQLLRTLLYQAMFLLPHFRIYYRKTSTSAESWDMPSQFLGSFHWLWCTMMRAQSKIFLVKPVLECNTSLQYSSTSHIYDIPHVRNWHWVMLLTVLNMLYSSLGMDKGRESYLVRVSFIDQHDCKLCNVKVWFDYKL